MSPGTRMSVALDAASGRLYVGASSPNAVWTLVGGTQRLLGTLVFGAGYLDAMASNPTPEELGVDEATNRICVAHEHDMVTVLEGSTNQVLTTLWVGSYPTGIAVDPSTHTAYVADIGDNARWVIQEHRFGPPTASVSVRAFADRPSPVADPYRRSCVETLYWFGRLRLKGVTSA